MLGYIVLPRFAVLLFWLIPPVIGLYFNKRALRKDAGFWRGMLDEKLKEAGDPRPVWEVINYFENPPREDDGENRFLVTKIKRIEKRIEGVAADWFFSWSAIAMFFVIVFSALR